MGAIRVHNLTVAYDRRPAIHHLDGAFAAGSATAIVGPNGAGKTTLLRAVAGLVDGVAGGIELQGVDRRQIAYLPQQASIDRSFPISVLDTVLLGRWRRRGMLLGWGAECRRAAHEALSAVGLHGFERRPIASLSVGQFQRVLFARLLLQDAPVILLDEPFNAIDATTTRDLLGVLSRWRGERRTVIAVLHDLEQVRGHFEQTLLLARECVAWGPTEGVLTAENRLRARRLAEAWAEDAAVCERAAA